jgi:hypothetical protein
MSNFDDRLERAKNYETALINMLNLSGFVTALNGTEHTHPDFVNKLRNSEDPTSLSIRFQPDGVAYIGNTPRSFYFEAKSSSTIEKNAYDQYMNLACNGNIVVLFFGSSGDEIVFRWVFVEDLKFTNSEYLLKKFKNQKGSKQKYIPIIYNWFYPRKLNDIDYNEWKVKYKASGTPYANIDKSCLLDSDVFKNLMVEKLKNILNL